MQRKNKNKNHFNGTPLDPQYIARRDQLHPLLSPLVLILTAPVSSCRLCMFCSLQKGRYQAIIADPYQLTLGAWGSLINHCIIDLNDAQTSFVRANFFHDAIQRNFYVAGKGQICSRTMYFLPFVLAEPSSIT